MRTLFYLFYHYRELIEREHFWVIKNPTPTI